MARDENPPFDRGHTWYDGETIDTNDLGGENLEGKEWVFEDTNPSTGVARTGREVRCRCVRNLSGATLYGKRLAVLDTTNAGEYSGQVLSYTTTAAQAGYPIDEYLPATGVLNGDLFWIVMEGPAVLLTSIDAGADNVIALGSWVVADAGAGSTATVTSGRAAVADFTGGTTPQSNMLLGRVGRALSAKTTANTDADLLIDCGKW